MILKMHTCFMFTYKFLSLFLFIKLHELWNNETCFEADVWL